MVEVLRRCANNCGVKREFSNLVSLSNYVIEKVSSGTPVILEAYPGFGKTKLASLILHKISKGLVAVRTHNEIHEVFNFLPTARGVTYAYGKPKICFKLKEFSYRTCRAYLTVGKCVTNFSHKDVAWLASTLRKPEEIADYGRKHGKCLCNAIKMLSMKSKKVVATYDYILTNPKVLEGKDVVILDESHHILNYMDEVVVVINQVFVEALFKQLKKDISLRPLAYALRAVFRKASSVRDFIEKLTEVLQHTYVNSNEALDLLDKVISAYYKKRYITSGSSYLFLTDTLPQLAKLRNKVMLGIYLPPFFISEKAEHIVIEGEPRIYAFIDSSVTTKYSERNSELYSDLAKKISEYTKNDCGNLVIFPSYSVMNEVVPQLPDNVKSRIIYADKKVSALPNGAILIDVAGGRIAEGVNIKNLSNVIIAGMPYPEPSPTLNLLSKVFGFENTFTYIALLRTYQAIGRIRGKGTAFLLDSRFLKYRNKMPKWIKLIN